MDLHKNVLQISGSIIVGIMLSAFIAIAPATARTIVLVHGAHVGAWYWAPVLEKLENFGHDVVAVDLTGHGERAGVDTSKITVEQHISDIVAAIKASPEPVVLVSHSYGGRPATGAWDKARDKVAAVIFLEAMAPYGKGANALPFDHVQRMAMVEVAPDAVKSGFLKVPGYLRKKFPDNMLVPQSVEALHAAIPLENGPLPETSGAYVLGKFSKARIYRTYARKIYNERDWTIWEIETGHDMVHENPDVVSRLLNKLANELPAK